MCTCFDKKGHLNTLVGRRMLTICYRLFWQHTFCVTYTLCNGAHCTTLRRCGVPSQRYIVAHVCPSSDSLLCDIIVEALCYVVITSTAICKYITQPIKQTTDCRTFWTRRPLSTAYETVLYALDEGLHSQNVLESVVWFIDSAMCLLVKMDSLVFFVLRYCRCFW